MVNGEKHNRNHHGGRALVSLYHPDPTTASHPAPLLPRPLRPPTVPTRPHPAAPGRRLDLGPNGPRPVLLDPHHRPLEGTLPPARPGRPGRPADRRATPLQRLLGHRCGPL